MSFISHLCLLHHISVHLIKGSIQYCWRPSLVLFCFRFFCVVMQCLIWFFVLFEFRKQKFCLQYLVFKNVGKETEQEVNKFSSAAQTSSVIQATSVKTQHDKINMNQDSKTNNITKAQNITRTITNTDVPPTSKKTQKQMQYSTWS